MLYKLGEGYAVCRRAAAVGTNSACAAARAALCAMWPFISPRSERRAGASAVRLPGGGDGI